MIADLDALLKRLNLAHTRKSYLALIARAETEQWSFHDFLQALAVEEVTSRRQSRIQRLSRASGFPFLKTIEEFDFSYQSALRLQMLGSALSPEFVSEGNSLIFSGKPGRGKTHLAVAIAYKAILNGFEPLFVTAAQLVDKLSHAFRAGEFSHALTRYTTPHLLVVDELGYLTYSTDAANMLFHVVNERHRKKRSMIFTTNKSLSEWGEALHDTDLAQAIVDRVLERGRAFILDGPSVRTRHLNLDESMAPNKRSGIRVSGIIASEFPEPTTRGRASQGCLKLPRQPCSACPGSAGKSVRRPEGARERPAQEFMMHVLQTPARFPVNAARARFAAQSNRSLPRAARRGCQTADSRPACPGLIASAAPRPTSFARNRPSRNVAAYGQTAPSSAAAPHPC